MATKLAIIHSLFPSPFLHFCLCFYGYNLLIANIDVCLSGSATIVYRAMLTGGIMRSSQPSSEPPKDHFERQCFDLLVPPCRVSLICHMVRMVFVFATSCVLLLLLFIFSICACFKPCMLILTLSLTCILSIFCFFFFNFRSLFTTLPCCFFYYYYYYYYYLWLVLNTRWWFAYLSCIYIYYIYSK